MAVFDVLNVDILLVIQDLGGQSKNKRLSVKHNLSKARNVNYFNVVGIFSRGRR